MLVGMYAAEVVKEVVQFFWYMRPYHEHVVKVMEPGNILVGCPAKCHFLKVFQVTMWAHGNPTHLFVELVIKV